VLLFGLAGNIPRGFLCTARIDTDIDLSTLRMSASIGEGFGLVWFGLVGNV
jgi:hypothetical protein